MRALPDTRLWRQVMTFSVAMNSARGHALVALLIASNFVEIKGAPGSSGGWRCLHAAPSPAYGPLCMGIPAKSSHETGCPRCH